MITKMTLTRALSKLKTIDSRLGSLRTQMLFTHKVGHRLSGTNLDGALFTSQAQSYWDEYQALVDARVAIKSAISKANAETIVVINGENLTIAAAVDRKLFYPKLLQQLGAVVQEYSKLSQSVEKHNQSVTERLDKMIESLVGKDKKMSEGELENVSKPYLMQNEASVFDPFDVYNKTTKQIEKIKAFMSEVDFALSEINAKTEVEVELKTSV